MNVFWPAAALPVLFGFVCPLGCSLYRQDQLSSVV